MRTIAQRCSVIAMVLLATTSPAISETLVLELDADRDQLSLIHDVPGMPFAETMNFSPDLPGNLSDRFHHPNLKNHLVISALVYLDGEVAGFATEQEIVTGAKDSDKPSAESAWLITLNHETHRGVVAVAQSEDASETIGFMAKVAANPDANWSDEEKWFRSTVGDPTIQLATGTLARYRGGRFSEFNYVNATDLARYGRFRARIRFELELPD